MSFLSLSHELIEQIASYLRLQDLDALVLSCKRFRDVVGDSLLLQYIYRTGLAGVYDPLCDLSTRSITDRMESLRLWEESWIDLEKYLATRRLRIETGRYMYGRPCFLSNDYLFYINCVNSQSDSAGLQPSSLEYIDLRDALRTGQYLWNRIDYPRGSSWVSQAFSIEEDDLVVSALSLPPVYDMRRRTILRFMSLKTGGIHPLAKDPDIQLDTELPLFPYNVKMDIIGDMIVLVLANLLHQENTENDYIYLVDWKQGRMTLVHSAPHGTYQGALSVLSSDLVLLLRRDTLSIELCRVTGLSPNPRGRSSSSNNGTPTTTPNLRVVRTLAFPNFHYHLGMAYMQTDRRIEYRHEPKVSALDRGQECMRPVRAPTPFSFHSAPEDMVVSITFITDSVIPDPTGLPVRRSVVTTISHRALFALAAEGPLPDGCQQRHDTSAGDGEVKTTVEQKQEMVVLWEEWGPQAARIIQPPVSSTLWITAHAGQRWLSLESDKLVIRDFSAARLRRAHAQSRSHRVHVSADTYEDDNEEEEDTAAVGETVIPGGSWSCFKDDVVSSLPFLETRVDVHEGASESILTDGRRLVIFVHSNFGRPLSFDVHVLEDKESLTEKRIPDIQRML